MMTSVDTVRNGFVLPVSECYFVSKSFGYKVLCDLPEYLWDNDDEDNTRNCNSSSGRNCIKSSKRRNNGILHSSSNPGGNNCKNKDMLAVSGTKNHKSTNKYLLKGNIASSNSSCNTRCSDSVNNDATVKPKIKNEYENNVTSINETKTIEIVSNYASNDFNELRDNCVNHSR